ncbi:hypothetical protein ACT3OH_08890 [Vreelandella zhanjiangensis]|uniref:hypothetical protein n=1 Tax=Vreelandella zhanjiangensis TaxID=1121960 RepID=UPI00402A71BF
MKLDDLVAQALSKIENMSVDEFERECHKAGYMPIRKIQASMHATMVVNAASVSVMGEITYPECHNFVMKEKLNYSFGSDFSSESLFPVAA